MTDVPAEIIELIEKFERNEQAYKNPSYKEEQLKQEFINPFFKALGWDIDNTGGKAPQYRDVIFEDRIKISGGTRAPDYCFTLAGRKMFFVEAKKPSVNIEKDFKPSYQLRRYAWSAKLPLSILTDFEEFAVYDARSRPKKTDRANVGRIKILNYENYADEWDYLYNTFSKNAVWQGAYDKYAEDTKKKRGTTEVDHEFLSEIENWRELLAKDIAIRNPDLTVDELNYSIQQIIDRIIFLRMGEDRGAEKYGQLQKLLDKKEIYKKLCEIWKEADGKYNSGLFHFKEEKEQNSPPDKLTPNLKIKDGVFKQIIQNLYYPDSPYEFSVLSPEILGNVYEQFLGRIIRLTPSHRAKVEEKPEVKKAGGVYYTPQYIVKYIVENTVGKLCKDNTPKKVSELRILDPACGSGSFLLEAYQYLLNWHLNYYTRLKDKKRLREQIYEGKNNEWYLTVKEKKRILLNNIFGVDIDHQAVEVTKLSLLLKVLEGENKDVIEAQQKLFKERALPDLENNIKCGNSLIGPEIYNDSDLQLNIEDIKRINPFDWNSEYSEIMENGGFDAVIGNPPYIRIHSMKVWSPFEVDFYKKIFKSAKKGNYDIYVIFIEKSINLLNDNGIIGLILPHKFFNAQYGEPIRSLLMQGKYLDTIVHFGYNQVFDRATTYTCLLFLRKNPSNKFKFVKVDDLDRWRLFGEKEQGKFNFDETMHNEWNFIIGPEGTVFKKLIDYKVKLGDLVQIFQGLTTGADKVFILEHLELLENSVRVKDHEGDEWEIEKEILKPLIKNVTVSTYESPSFNHWIIFPYEVNDKALPLKKDHLKAYYPKAYKYLINKKPILVKKSNTDSSNWWLYSYPKNLKLHQKTKLIVQVISKRGNYGFDDKGLYFTGGGNGPYYGLFFKKDNPHSLKYLQGILSSKLLDFYLHRISSPFRGGYWSYGKRFIEKIPIRTIDFSNPDDKARHDKMVVLIERMTQLYVDLENSRTPNDQNIIKRQIESLDNQINNLVYELYGLTKKDVNIVEKTFQIKEV